MSWRLQLLALSLMVSGCVNVTWSQVSSGLTREMKTLPGFRAAPSHAAQAPSVAQPSTVLAPFAIAPGPDGNLWFTELNAPRIGRISAAGQIDTFELKSGGLPERLTAGPDDAIWFTDPAGNRIGRLGLDGATA